MKTLFAKIATVTFLAMLTLQMSHAGTLSGKQTRGAPGRNAKLECKAVTIAKAQTITAVSGSNRGFWVKNSSGDTVMQFSKSNDPSAVGKTLQPGTYYVYPNLERRVNTATVTLTLK